MGHSPAAGGHCYSPEGGAWPSPERAEGQGRLLRAESSPVEAGQREECRRQSGLGSVSRASCRCVGFDGGTQLAAPGPEGGRAVRRVVPGRRGLGLEGAEASREVLRRARA